MNKILIYNNQTKIAERMEPFFNSEGYSVITAEDTEDLIIKMQEKDIQLIILDVELHDKGWDRGIQMISELRHATSIPLIVVSGQSADTAKIMALEAGADDYVTSGCNELELLARVKSQIRRYQQLISMYVNIDRIYRYEDLVIDDNLRTVTVSGRNVRLTPIEYKILRFLVQKKGKVFSNNQIYEEIWKMQAFGADNTIAVHVRHIREKIEKDPKEPKYIKVVWGVGYKVG